MRCGTSWCGRSAPGRCRTVGAPQGPPQLLPVVCAHAQPHARFPHLHSSKMPAIGTMPHALMFMCELIEQKMREKVILYI